MITFAAIEQKGIVYIGLPSQRHCHIINDTSRPFGFMKGGIQGFVDENGKFYNRHDAVKHAFECGQLKYDATCPNTILSEDLW